MSVCSMDTLLREAELENRAVGAFNVGNMEMVMGVLEAAETNGTPVILQIAEKRLCHSPLELMGPMMIAAASKAKARVAVHLDHGRTPAILRQAMDLGFTSVMFDGSELPLEENIAQTRAIVREASARNIRVEAEIGVVGCGEDDRACTVPADAARLYRETGCDALAVAIGNAHGHYRAAPRLRFDVLQEIQEQVRVPLVLHGGSGISLEDFRKAIALGIRKINIATASFDAMTQGAARYLRENPRPDGFALSGAMERAVRECAVTHIKIFNNREAIE